MEEQFLPYEQSLKLKELGFDEQCFGYYTGDKNHFVWRPDMLRRNDEYVVTAPLYQQVFDWFREEHGLHCEIEKIRDNIYSYGIYSDDNKWFGYKEFDYEVARQKGIEQLIEIVENN